MRMQTLLCSFSSNFFLVMLINDLSGMYMYVENEWVCVGVHV